jgi:hypothetical protein
MKTLKIFIIALTVLNFGALAAFGGDMWSETPGLENPKPRSFNGEPARLSNDPPTVDMWAETPALNNKNASVDFNHENAIIKSGLADSELYAETPDLDKVSPAESDLLSPVDVMVAEQENNEMTK